MSLQGHGFGGQYRCQNVTATLAFKRNPSGGQFIEYYPKTPDVGLFTHLETARLLWRHVLGCAHDFSRISLHYLNRSRLGITMQSRKIELRQTKVEHLYITIASDHHILWLNVSMYYSGRMGRRQCGSDLTTDVQHLFDRQPLFCHELT